MRAFNLLGTSVRVIFTVLLLATSCQSSFADDPSPQPQLVQVKPSPLVQARLAGGRMPLRPAITIEDLQSLYPWNKFYTTMWCDIDFVKCSYGTTSTTYQEEMALRNQIEQERLNLRAWWNAQPAPLFLIEQAEKRIAELTQRLKDLLEGRPLPDEDDECLTEYRECLVETFPKDQ